MRFYGAKRHVPRFHHGLKVPTPPVGGVQGAKGAPPVVEEGRGRGRRRKAGLGGKVSLCGAKRC